MKNKLKIGIIVCMGWIAVSCSDLTFGDRFLGNQPESSGATLDSVFGSMVSADKVLTKAYTYLPYGLPTGGGVYNRMGVAVLENITDLNQSFRDNMSDGPLNLYYSGALSSTITSTLQGSEAYRLGGELDWNAIRYAWMYVENVHRVPDMSAEQKAARSAEAKMIIALSYAEMMRNIGGVPWLDHSVDVNETMKFPRISFAETVDKIVALLDEAIPHLTWKWDDVNDGRMSKAGAMGLKLRVLLFAASPTFNSGTLWHPSADAFTCYTNVDKKRWERAKKAGEDFMKELTLRKSYQLTQPLAATPYARRMAYRSAYYDRGGTEVLISTRRGYDDAVHSSYMGQRYYFGPTLNYVNMFPWADGRPFPENFNWQSPSEQPFFSNGVPTRDPRLYENVAVPGDTYVNGNLAPVYSNHPQYKKGSGFLMMKFILQNTEDRSKRPTQWPYLRLPEVLLSYAEAINEFDGEPNQTAYDCLNEVRARVGLSALSGLSKKEFTKALLDERALELGFEEVRWYDLIRWGMKDDFCKKLYGLDSKGDNQNNPTRFTFKKTELTERYWASTWDTKWYLSPIPQEEITKNYGMTQNPGW